MAWLIDALYEMHYCYQFLFVAQAITRQIKCRDISDAELSWTIKVLSRYLKHVYRFVPKYRTVRADSKKQIYKNQWLNFGKDCAHPGAVNHRVGEDYAQVSSNKYLA
ncbi:hypothetical protein AAKU67_002481 [Oxalobacteraceae bacterium GrIS 2.11]